MSSESTPSGPPGPSEPAKKKDKATPDEKSFKEMMKIKKTDPEEQKKRKKYQFEEEVKIPTPEKLTTQKEKKELEKIKIDLSNKFLEKTDPKSQKKMINALEKELEKEPIKESSPIKIVPKEKTSPKKIEKEEKKEKQIKKKKEEVPVKKETHKIEISSNPNILKIPDNLMATASVKTAQVSPMMPSREIMPLFEHTIGTILVMQEKGISSTHIVLNNPKFEASRFFGMEIIIEKYASAPDSFNITFTGGNQEAISLVNEHIEGLYKVFEKAELPFSIGKISAEYNPLFKRKEKANNKDTNLKK